MTLQNRRFVLLVIALAIYLVISPFLVDTPMLAYVVGLFFTLVMISSLYIMEHEKHFLVTSIVLLVLALSGNWVLVSDLTRNPYFQFGVYVISSIFFFVITYFIVRYVMHHKTVTFNSLCGAVCGYLMIGLTWSYIYRAVYVFSHASFHGVGLEALSPDSLEQHFSYFSFVTLTTLGYGDISPVSNTAKMFAWVEAVIGQIYLTMWIARLVGLHISAETIRERKDHEKSVGQI